MKIDPESTASVARMKRLTNKKKNNANKQTVKMQLSTIRSKTKFDISDIAVHLPGPMSNPL